MQLKVERPSSFTALTDIKISERGLPFYETQKGKKFNLPKGDYFVWGFIKEVPFERIEKVFDVTPILLLPEKQFKIFFVDDYPNTCSVDLETGHVIADSKFQKLPKFIFAFVISHEMGHFRYRGLGQLSEMQCDSFAREMMLDEGFNPSQIDLAAKLTLSDSLDACKRKKLSFEHLKKKR